MPKANTYQNMYSCCQCNRHFKTLAEFYKTYSGLYSGTGYLPICRSCLLKLYERYLKKYEDKQLAMQRICMAFDLYYDEKTFRNCLESDGTPAIGNYIRMMNMVQYKGKTFDSTLDEKKTILGFTKKRQIVKNVEPETTVKVPDAPDVPDVPDVSDDDIEKWGSGLEPDDYGTLNSHYSFLTKANPNCDSNQEIFINDLCITKMLQMKAVREGDVDSYNKLTESYRKSFQQAGLKTVRDASSAEDFTIGVNCEMIEKYTPADYYKNKELYKDFDGIGDYITRFMFRPLKNLMFGSEERDKEYYVKDEDNSNGSEAI